MVTATAAGFDQGAGQERIRSGVGDGQSAAPYKRGHPKEESQEDKTLETLSELFQKAWKRYLSIGIHLSFIGLPQSIASWNQGHSQREYMISLILSRSSLRKDTIQQ